MTDNLKKFLELLSQEDEAFIERVNRADDAGVIAIAKEKGLALTEEDLAQFEPEGEVPLDEADAVAGGKQCVCVLGGGGQPSGKCDLVCACTGGGTGYGADRENPSSHYQRCWCAGIGHGYNANKEEG